MLSPVYLKCRWSFWTLCSLGSKLNHVFVVKPTIFFKDVHYRRLRFRTYDPSFLALVEACREQVGGEGFGAFGMLGIDPRAPPGGEDPAGTSQLPPRWRRMLRFGTEAQIVAAILDGAEVEVEIVGRRR